MPPGGAHENMQTWQPEDDLTILRLHGEIGPKWQQIAEHLPGRSTASIRNRFQRIQRGQAKAAAEAASGAPLKGNRCTVCGQIKKGHICVGKLDDGSSSLTTAAAAAPGPSSAASSKPRGGRSGVADSPAGGGGITVDALLDTLRYHVPPIKQRVFELRLGELRQLAAAEGGKVTSELSKKIGLYFGADVMVKLLASIQALERGEALPAGASPGVDVPHVSTRDEEQSARVLVHALLCPGPGRCGRPDCNDEVAATKAYLARLEAHSQGCSVANLPGGKRDCPTCAKWIQLQRLRERFARMLRQQTQQKSAAARVAAAGAAAAAGADGGEKKRRGKEKAPPPAAADDDEEMPPPMPQRAVTDILNSVRGESGNDGSVHDLARLPELVDAMLHQEKERRRNLSHMKRKRETAADRASRGGVSFADLAPDQLGSGGVPGGKKKARLSDAKTPSGGGVKFNLPRSGAPKSAAGVLAQEAAEKGKTKISRSQAVEQLQIAADERRIVEMITDGARLANTPKKPRRQWAPNDEKGGKKGGRGGGGASSSSSSEAGMAAEDGVLVGMHIAFDEKLPKAGALPDAWAPIASSAPPGPSRVAEVTAVHPDGRCDALVVCNGCGGAGSLGGAPKAGKGKGKAAASGGGGGCGGACGAGRALKGLAPPQRQIVCSGCQEANLCCALPQLLCCGCEQEIKPGSTYHRAPPIGDQHTDLCLCVTCHSGLLDGGAKAAEVMAALDETGVGAAPGMNAFAELTWRPEDEREFDDYVQCTECDRWHHFVCAMYPAPEQMPASWQAVHWSFVCSGCKGAGQAKQITALQNRRAASLPKCAMAVAVEAFVAKELKAAKVKVAAPIIVRVVSRKDFLFPAVKQLKQRYGDNYAREFPYTSQALLAFQQVGGRDVCLFGMYVQEYGEDCPAPNTNRVYISYVDSVRYLESTGGERGGRTPLYHAIINGYLKHAADRGFGFAHLWVAPPEEGVEYIFHAPNHGQRKPMTPAVLRAWYEKMLDRAEELGIVSNVNSLQKEVAHLTSVRDFPTFDGDFFPDRFPDIIKKAASKTDRLRGAPPTSGRGGPPALARAQSLALAAAAKEEVESASWDFLVAHLQATSAPPSDKREPPCAHDLIDSRMRFLETSVARHWQFDELRRAHWSTMMLLANLGGRPD